MASPATALESGLYADPARGLACAAVQGHHRYHAPIVDPHHHLSDRSGQRYLIEEIALNIAYGRNIVATVYVVRRCCARAGPKHPAGRRGRFANGVSPQWRDSGYGPATIYADILSRVDLLFGEGRARRAGAEDRRQIPQRFAAFGRSSACNTTPTSPGCTTRRRTVSIPPSARFTCLPPARPELRRPGSSSRKSRADRSRPTPSRHEDHQPCSGQFATSAAMPMAATSVAIEGLDRRDCPLPNVAVASSARDAAVRL